MPSPSVTLGHSSRAATLSLTIPDICECEQWRQDRPRNGCTDKHPARREGPDRSVGPGTNRNPNGPDIWVISRYLLTPCRMMRPQERAKHKSSRPKPEGDKGRDVPACRRPHQEPSRESANLTHPVLSPCFRRQSLRRRATSHASGSRYSRRAAVLSSVLGMVSVPATMADVNGSPNAAWIRFRFFCSFGESPSEGRDG